MVTDMPVQDIRKELTYEEDQKEQAPEDLSRAAILSASQDGGAGVEMLPSLSLLVD